MCSVHTQLNPAHLEYLIALVEQDEDVFQLRTTLLLDDEFYSVKQRLEAQLAEWTEGRG